ncbi:MAG: ABC transporter transmembrane domain-containing protein, partial [Clostridia bacterium]
MGKNKETLKKVLSYIGIYKIFLAMSVIFAGVSVALTLYVPILTGDAIDLIIDEGLVDFIGLGKILLKIVIVVGITALLQWLMNVCNNKITYNVIRDIRRDAFAKIEILPLKYIDSHPTGEIVSRVIADVDQFADGLLMGFTQLFTGVMTILGTLIFMLTINVKISFVVILITPVS